MNPLTNVKNINKLNEREAELGINSKSSWHQQYKDSAYIFIGGLPYDLTEGDIICVFSQYGEIVNINLVRDKKTGKSKGYCFIAYEDQRSTILAVDNLNGIKLLGRTLRVDHVEEYRKPKEDENDDEVTKKLRQDGCAPRTPSPVSEKEEEPLTPPYKDKDSSGKRKKKTKKEKKKKKKKERVTSSSSDSESDQMSRQGNVTKEKQDRFSIKTEKHAPMIERDIGKSDRDRAYQKGSKEVNRREGTSNRYRDDAREETSRSHREPPEERDSERDSYRKNRDTRHDRYESSDRRDRDRYRGRRDQDYKQDRDKYRDYHDRSRESDRYRGSRRDRDSERD